MVEIKGVMRIASIRSCEIISSYFTRSCVSCFLFYLDFLYGYIFEHLSACAYMFKLLFWIFIPTLLSIHLCWCHYDVRQLRQVCMCLCQRIVDIVKAAFNIRYLVTIQFKWQPIYASQIPQEKLRAKESISEIAASS